MLTKYKSTALETLENLQICEYRPIYGAYKKNIEYKIELLLDKLGRVICWYNRNCVRKHNWMESLDYHFN